MNNDAEDRKKRLSEPFTRLHLGRYLKFAIRNRVDYAVDDVLGQVVTMQRDRDDAEITG